MRLMASSGSPSAIAVRAVSIRETSSASVERTAEWLTRWAAARELSFQGRRSFDVSGAVARSRGREIAGWVDQGAWPLWNEGEGWWRPSMNPAVNPLPPIAPTRSHLAALGQLSDEPVFASAKVDGSGACF